MGHEKDDGREMPRAHLIHLSSALAMTIIIFLDSFLQITTPILSFIPMVVRIILCGIVLFFALTFVIRSHNALFGGEEHEPNYVITTGIFDQVRHPMYVGILLTYFAFIVLSVSLIALGVWIGIVIIYDRMASYEEKVLEELFGDDYREYKKRTSKWLPR
ncbi:MAG: methyltransferase family protein [Candidatus Helarchaeota archaeon]